MTETAQNIYNAITFNFNLIDDNVNTDIDNSYNTTNATYRMKIIDYTGATYDPSKHTVSKSMLNNWLYYKKLANDDIVFGYRNDDNSKALNIIESIDLLFNKREDNFHGVSIGNTYEKCNGFTINHEQNIVNLGENQITCYARVNNDLGAKTKFVAQDESKDDTDGSTFNEHWYKMVAGQLFGNPAASGVITNISTLNSTIGAGTASMGGRSFGSQFVNFLIPSILKTDTDTKIKDRGAPGLDPKNIKEISPSDPNNSGRIIVLRNIYDQLRSNYASRFEPNEFISGTEDYYWYPIMFDDNDIILFNVMLSGYVVLKDNFQSSASQRGWQLVEPGGIIDSSLLWNEPVNTDGAGQYVTNANISYGNNVAGNVNSITYNLAGYECVYDRATVAVNTYATNADFNGISNGFAPLEDGDKNALNRNCVSLTGSVKFHNVTLDTVLNNDNNRYIVATRSNVSYSEQQGTMTNETILANTYQFEYVIRDSAREFHMNDLDYVDFSVIKNLYVDIDDNGTQYELTGTKQQCLISETKLNSFDIRLPYLESGKVAYKRVQWEPIVVNDGTYIYTAPIGINSTIKIGDVTDTSTAYIGVINSVRQDDNDYIYNNFVLDYDYLVNHAAGTNLAINYDHFLEHEISPADGGKLINTIDYPDGYKSIEIECVEIEETNTCTFDVENKKITLMTKDETQSSILETILTFDPDTKKISLSYKVGTSVLTYNTDHFTTVIKSIDFDKDIYSVDLEAATFTVTYSDTSTDVFEKIGLNKLKITVTPKSLFNKIIKTSYVPKNNPALKNKNLEITTSDKTVDATAGNENLICNTYNINNYPKFTMYTTINPFITVETKDNDPDKIYLITCESTSENLIKTSIAEIAVGGIIPDEGFGRTSKLGYLTLSEQTPEYHAYTQTLLNGDGTILDDAEDIIKGSNKYTYKKKTRVELVNESSNLRRKLQDIELTGKLEFRKDVAKTQVVYNSTYPYGKRDIPKRIWKVPLKLGSA